MGILVGSAEGRHEFLPNMDMMVALAPFLPVLSQLQLDTNIDNIYHIPSVISSFSVCTYSNKKERGDSPVGVSR